MNIDEIESEVAFGSMSAAQVFTQMKQHVSKCEKETSRYHYGHLRNFESFAECLIAFGLIDHNAIYDAEDYDGGTTKQGVERAFLSIKNQPVKS